ncbi:MAG: ribbon-helix-helix protein, CopG family [Acutalibacteraceae bacterium]|nr:ribbon-helix-helix protein, CopG family [Acutalibacteraceae bacterium]
MKEKLIINKKSLKGEDGYKTFSIRIKDKTVNDLDALSKETNRSRNELINTLLEDAINNCEVWLPSNEP